VNRLDRRWDRDRSGVGVEAAIAYDVVELIRMGRRHGRWIPRRRWRLQSTRAVRDSVGTRRERVRRPDPVCVVGHRRDTRGWGVAGRPSRGWTDGSSGTTG